MVPTPAATATAATNAVTSPAVITFGTRRHAWVRYPVSGGGGASTAAAAVVAAAAAVPTAAAYFSTGGSGVSGDLPPPPPPTPLQPDGRMLLSFTLVNAAPTRSGHLYSWRFGRDVERRFVSHASRALKRLATVNLEGQVLHHAPSRHNPEWNDTLGAFTVPASRAPFFVDSDWWGGWGGGSVRGG
jgi:hypothetical protein